ncbi:MAG TPA: nuclear transport factor 2 family protein, partial [Chloroflexota bacterium]
RRDVDAALSYFADDASVSVRNTLYSGKDEIRKYLDGPISRSRFVVVSDRRVSGSHVTWTERSGNQNAAQPQAQGPNTPASGGGVNANAAVNVEAMVQEGKIRSLTYLVGNQLSRVDPSLEGRAQLPASVGLAAVLAVVLGVVLFASVGLRRGSSGASTLRGRLMQDLKGWTAARQSL